MSRRRADYFSRICVQGLHQARMFSVGTFVLGLAYASPALPQVAGQTQAWRVSKVVGVPVVSPQGEQIGVIEDLIIDKDGVVKLLVINVIAGNGQPNHLVPVLPQVMRFPNPDPTTTRWWPDQAVIATSRSALLGLPVLDQP